MVSLIALAGTSMTLSTHNIGHTAEVSTLGSYAKAWFREDNGIPSLYKTYGSEKDEGEREVLASNVIDCFNVYGNLKYEYVIFEEVRCSKCKLMTTDDIGMLHAADLKQGKTMKEAAQHYVKRSELKMIKTPTKKNVSKSISI